MIFFSFFCFGKGWKPAARTTRISRVTSEPNDPDTLCSALTGVYNAVKNQSHAWPFLKPVDKNEVPDYYHHIKYPMGELSFFFTNLH